MKRFPQAVILLLVTTFLPVLVLFSFSAGAGHASALKPKPTTTPSCCSRCFGEPCVRMLLMHEKSFMLFLVTREMKLQQERAS